MGFIEIEKRKGAGTLKPEVTVSFSPRGGGKPCCTIVLRADFLARSGFGDAETYRVAVDAENDKIKLWPDTTGSFSSQARQRDGARLVSLGHVVSFGARQHKRKPCAVALVEGAAVLTLPALVDDARGDGGASLPSPLAGECDDARSASAGEGCLSAKPAVEATPSKPAAAKPSAAAQMVEFPELTVDLAEGHERVIRNRDCVEVSPRGARLVVALAKVMPGCVGDDWLLTRLWDKKPTGGAASLEMVIADLKGLKKLGLEIRNQRGIGRQLVVL
ncbi:hypothetical protein [Bradyrhizobium sp. HKCCYLR1051]|uniref:hypothetical protein n=1 Tax=Bradyrhizobium sp. HKCCYLR1051 TaxID=3420738 RepID=UPI003EBBC5C4